MKETDSGHSSRDSLKKLMEIIRKLRSPDGCMWDRQQSIKDVGRYLMDEAYEVADAIESGTPEALKEELGDLLFQILFIADIAEEAGSFSISEVMENVTEKMIRRHPHVFGNWAVRDIDEIRSNWEDIKTHVENRKKKDGFLFSGISRSMPSLLAAQKMTENAPKVGFDWEKAEDVVTKIEEEVLELKTAIQSDDNKKVREEMGDLFLSLVNICRFVDVNAEESLKTAIHKFGGRFQYVEDKLAAKGKTPMEASLADMDELWDESKSIEGK
jgi:tetrapyrrole methylase family protein/MazG family protein